MFNLFKKAVDTVTSFLSGGAKSSGGGGGGGGWGTTKPAPAPLQPLTQLPKISWQIPTWQQYQSGTYNYAAANASNARQLSYSQEVNRRNAERIRQNEIAAAALREKLRREAEERERKRREKQAALDKVHGALKTDRRNQAQKALDQLAKDKDPNDWRTYFDDVGNFRGAGIKDASGFQIPNHWFDDIDSFKKAKNSWSKWAASPEGQTYIRTREEYKQRAQNIIDQTKKAPSGGFWTQAFDKLTFGGTRRAMAARETAGKFAESTGNDQVKRYEENRKSFLDEQAKRSQELQSKKFGSWSEYNQVVEKYRKWESDEISKLEYARAATDGMVEGYQGKSTEKINNLPGKIGNWLHGNIVQGPIGDVTGGIWKYTLGSGNEKIPSMVTAPARGVNTFLNFVSGNKTINDKQGNSRPSTGNAWVDSFNQSNVNATYAGQKYQDYARNKFLSLKNPRNPLGAPVKFSDLNNKKQSNFDQKEFEKWEAANRGSLDKEWREKEERAKSTYQVANDLALDPLSYLGVSKFGSVPGKAASWTSRVTKPAGQLKPVKAAGNFLTTVKQSKPVSWLAAESRSPNQKYSDALTEANRLADEVQADLLPRFRNKHAILQHHDQILKGKFDDSIIDDFRRMAEAGDNEAARWLQEMRKGDFSTRAKIQNWTRAGGMGSNPRLTKLKEVADKWSEFAENMRKGDAVDQASTRFGKGKDRSFYSPRTVTFSDLDDYDFRKQKTNLRPQSAEDLYRGVVDRYFKSDVIDYWGDTQKGKVATAKKGVQALRDEYDTRLAPSRATVEAARAKTRTPYGRMRNVFDEYSPTALWRKSVLKYRPAWYVNNFVSNTQAAGLAGGGEAFIDQFRLMKPSNYKAAMRELPKDVRTTIAKEIGKTDKLSKFGNALENAPRMAAYRALIKKGLSHDEALKRVDRYLYNYKIRNVERPLRAVMPFYTFQKGTTKAAAQMTHDRPLAAMAYNRLDRHQQQQFENDFDSLIPQLKEFGYTDEEIEQIREEQSVYYRDRLKVGDKYINTPFNPFSQKGGFDGGGINPWISSLAESMSGKNRWGQTLAPSESSLEKRILNKFPQADLAKKGIDKYLVDSGRKKPAQSWIGAPGSGGYGMTKQAQGYDPSKPNYQERLDPGAKFMKDLTAFLGVPRGTKFDPAKIIEFKKLEKLKTEYFAINWKDMPFPEQESKRAALFKKFGMTADEFYDGTLSKYDTPETKRIKALKEEAFNKTKQLFEEYGRQPYGTRNVWATKKLKELVDSGYFATNPFLKSFDWTDPGTIAKAHKKMEYDQAVASGNFTSYRKKYPRAPSQKSLDYQRAKSSGNWSAYTAKYGSKFAPSEKKIARDKAVASGDWTEYRAKYGVNRKSSPYQYEGKYFKSEATMNKYIEGEFWRKYAAADPVERRKLIADNPKYNRRSNWSEKMWDDWKARQKTEQRRKLMGLTGFSDLFAENVAKNEKGAAPMIYKKKHRKTKLAFSIR